MSSCIAVKCFVVKFVSHEVSTIKTTVYILTFHVCNYEYPTPPPPPPVVVVRWQRFCSLGDHTIASFTTSQSALWHPCCSRTSHSTLCPDNKKIYSTFRVVTDKNHELGSLERYAFNQTTVSVGHLRRVIKLNSSRSSVLPPHRLCSGDHVSFFFFFFWLIPFSIEESTV